MFGSNSRFSNSCRVCLYLVAISPFLLFPLQVHAQFCVEDPNDPIFECMPDSTDTFCGSELEELLCKGCVDSVETEECGGGAPGTDIEMAPNGGCDVPAGGIELEVHDDDVSYSCPDLEEECDRKVGESDLSGDDLLLCGFGDGPDDGGDIGGDAAGGSEISDGGGGSFMAAGFGPPVPKFKFRVNCWKGNKGKCETFQKSTRKICKSFKGQRTIKSITGEKKIVIVPAEEVVGAKSMLQGFQTVAGEVTQISSVQYVGWFPKGTSVFDVDTLLFQWVGKIKLPNGSWSGKTRFVSKVKWKKDCN